MAATSDVHALYFDAVGTGKLKVVEGRVCVRERGRREHRGGEEARARGAVLFNRSR